MRTFKDLAIGEHWGVGVGGKHFVKISHDDSRECDADGWVTHDGNGVPNFGECKTVRIRRRHGDEYDCKCVDERGVNHNHWMYGASGFAQDRTHWRPHQAEKAAQAATTPNPDMRPDSDRERAYRLKQEAEKEQAKLQREKEAAARKSEGDGLTTVAPTPRFGWLGGLR